MRQLPFTVKHMPADPFQNIFQIVLKYHHISLRLRISPLSLHPGKCRQTNQNRQQRSSRRSKPHGKQRVCKVS